MTIRRGDVVWTRRGQGPVLRLAVLEAARNLRGHFEADIRAVRQHRLAIVRPCADFVPDVLSTHRGHYAEVVVEGLQAWVTQFYKLDLDQPQNCVVALDTEGHTHTSGPAPTSWRTCLCRKSLHAVWAQIAAAHSTVVFRLTPVTWKIACKVLKNPLVTTAVFNEDAEMKALASLPTGGIAYAETRSDAGESLTTAYSRVHARRGGGPWQKKCKLLPVSDRKIFYDQFLSTKSLPPFHVQYAAADAIATRNIYLARHGIDG